MPANPIQGAAPRRADQKEIRFGVSSVVSPANAFAGRRQGRADGGDERTCARSPPFLTLDELRLDQFIELN